MPTLLDRTFKLNEHGTSVKTEILAGVTTFLTMAYILFVNPTILSSTGMPKDAVFVATCVVAALGTIVMALYANYPIAVAPGMGLNAYFAYTVVGSMGYSWQAALGAVFLSGCLFLLISALGLRSLLITGIPQTLRAGTSAGIGLFLAIIGLSNAGIVVASPKTLVTLGDMHSIPVLLAWLGFFLIVALDYLKVTGSVLIGILVVSALSFLVGGNHFEGVVSIPSSIAPTFLALDIKGALAGGLVNVVLVLFLVELFDATGTLMGVARRAGLYVGNPTPDQDRRLRRALMADSTAIVAGSVLFVGILSFNSAWGAYMNNHAPIDVTVEGVTAETDTAALTSNIQHVDGVESAIAIPNLRVTQESAGSESSEFHVLAVDTKAIAPVVRSTAGLEDLNDDTLVVGGIYDIPDGTRVTLTGPGGSVQVTARVREGWGGSR